MRNLIISVFALTMAFPSSGRTEAFIDKPHNFRVIVLQVGSVLTWGIWLEKCIGDPLNAEYLDNLETTRVWVTKLAGNDDVRAAAVMSAAIPEAENQFSGLNCTKDADFVRRQALSVVEGLPDWLQMR